MSTLLDNIQTKRDQADFIKDFRPIFKRKNGGINAGQL